jgi:hypothetical protein
VRSQVVQKPWLSFSIAAVDCKVIAIVDSCVVLKYKRCKEVCGIVQSQISAISGYPWNRFVLSQKLMHVAAALLSGID